MASSVDAQILAGLRDRVSQSLSERRPLLHHLNADSSWLLQIPLPASSSSRHWYNILIDPWLTGSQSDVASWFSQQWHADAPALGSIAAVEELCRHVEALCTTTAVDPSHDSHINLVAVSHEFTDHCHKATLLQCPRTVPVFAADKAAKLIRGWNHFDTVVTLPSFSADWRACRCDPLPSWLSVSRLTTPNNSLYYHAAVLIAFSAANDPSDAPGQPNADAGAEAVIYTPHGIHAPSLEAVAAASPPVKTLAFLHGLHDVRIDWGQQLNLGAHNGLAAQRLLGAKYWIGTHDEVKKGGGVVSWFLRRKVYTVKDALEKEARTAGEKPGVDAGNNVLGGGNQFLNVGNGQAAVLA